MRAPFALHRAVAAAFTLSAALALAVGGLVAGGGAAAAASTASVSVDATTNLGGVPNIGLGINNAIYDGHLLDSSLPGLLKSAGVEAMRFPGGSVADIYHWQNNTAVGTTVAPGDNFDSWMGQVRATGAQPIVIANYGSGTAQEAASWVQYANVTKGYGVKYWEIGNEVYGNGAYGSSWENDTHSTKNATTYANNLVQYSEAMKAVDPSIQIGAVLTTPGYWPDGLVASGDSQDWNHTVLSIAAAHIDFVIVHYYPSSSSESSLLTQPAGIPSITATLRSLISQYGGSRASSIGVAVTETNDNSHHQSQAAAIYAAADYATWLQNGVFNVDWWDTHNGASGAQQLTDAAGHSYTDYGDEGALSNGSCSGSSCEPAAETPFPAYYALDMLGSYMQPGDTMVRASSSTGKVVALAVKRPSTGGVNVMLLNEDPSNSYNVSLSYTGYSAGSASVGVFTDGAHGIATSSGQSSTSVTLPPYSITVLHSAAGSGGTPPPSGFPSGYHSLTVANNGLCLDSFGNTSNAGAVIDQSTCTGGSNQSFQFVAGSGGYGQLQVQSSGQVVTVANGSTAQGSPDVVQEPSGAAGSQWLPQQQSDGSWQFKNQNSGLCLDVYGASSTNGQQLDQWPCKNAPGTNQDFNVN